MYIVSSISLYQSTMHTTTLRLKEECVRLTPKHETNFSLSNIPNLFSELFTGQEQLSEASEAPASLFEDSNTKEMRDMMHHLQVLMIKADNLNGRTLKAEIKANDAEKHAATLKQDVTPSHICFWQLFFN